MMQKLIGFLMMGIAIFCRVLALAEDDYYPLHVGDEWAWDVIFTSPKGAKQMGIRHCRIGETVELQGQRYCTNVNWVEGGPFRIRHTKFIRKDNDGLHRINEEMNAPEQIEIKLPLKVGDKWTLTAHRGVTLNVTVVGLDDVEAGGNNYPKCVHIHVESSDGNSKEDSWLAEGVGEVKETVTNADGWTWSAILKEFKPGK